MRWQKKRKDSHAFLSEVVWGGSQMMEGFTALYGRDNLRWEVFWEAFLEEFFPDTLQERKQIELTNLLQWYFTV